MTVKVRDAAGVLRTIDSLKVRDGAGVLRTIDFVRVRGPDGVLREVYAAGGEPPASNPSYISPGSDYTSGTTASASAYFTAYSSGDAPTAYAWGVLDGPGSVLSGATTATAQLRVTAGIGDYAVATFYCDLTIGGTIFRATCAMTRERYGSGGGGQPLQ